MGTWMLLCWLNTFRSNYVHMYSYTCICINKSMRGFDPQFSFILYIFKWTSFFPIIQSKHTY